MMTDETQMDDARLAYIKAHRTIINDAAVEQNRRVAEIMAAKGAHGLAKVVRQHADEIEATRP